MALAAGPVGFPGERYIRAFEGGSAPGAVALGYPPEAAAVRASGLQQEHGFVFFFHV